MGADFFGEMLQINDVERKIKEKIAHRYVVLGLLLSQQTRSIRVEGSSSVYFSALLCE